MANSESAKVIKAQFISAGRHHPQFMRHYQMNATSENIQDMLEALGGTDFNEDSVGGWAGGLIQVASQVDDCDEALIPHGFDGERLRLFMHCQLKDRTYNDTIDFYVTGFTENNTLYETDRDSLTMHDDTRIFINSIMRIRRTAGSDMDALIGGSGTRDDTLEIEANSHNLIAYTEDDRYDRNHNEFHALRPYDLAVNLDKNNTQYVMDTRSDFSTNLTKSSSRSNTSPNSYLGRTIGAMVEGNREAITSRDWRKSSNTSEHINTQRILGENDTARCKLTRMLKLQTGITRNGYLTWQEFKSVFDGIEDDRYTSVMQEQEVERREREDNNAGRTSNLNGRRMNGSDFETTASYTALNSISGIMMECCITQAHFTACTVDGRGNVEFAFKRGTAPTFFIRGLTEDQQEDKIRSLEYRLRKLVFDPLVYQVRKFDMEANMDAVGDSQMFLSIQGDRESEFWGATFADGSTSSLISTRENAAGHLAADANRLVGALIGSTRG